MKVYKSIAAFLEVMNIPLKNKVTDIFIFKMEDYLNFMPTEMEAYRKDCFQVTFGLGHNVAINVDSSKYVPIEKMISFSTPYHIKSFKVKSLHKNALSYMILFTPSALSTSYSNLDLFRKYQFFNLNSKPAISLSEKEAMVIEKLMNEMHKEFINKNESTDAIVKAYLTIILEKTNLFFKSPSANILFSNRAEEIAFQYENLLKEKSNYKLRLGDYASLLHISATYLSEAVKKATGKSAKSMASEMLVLKAKGELLQKKDTIATISDHLGFNDTSNFVKFFKTNTGLTPNQYRKSK